MKKRLFVLLASLAALAAFPACDQHQWEDSEDGTTPGTKHLFEKHDHGGHDQHADHAGGDKSEAKKDH